MIDSVRNYVSNFLAYLNAVPEPGASDPLFNIIVLIVIVALGIAGLIVAIIWPLNSISRDPFAEPFGDVPPIPAGSIMRSDRR